VCIIPDGEGFVQRKLEKILENCAEREEHAECEEQAEELENV
jgi:hypothetical protein